MGRARLIPLPRRLVWRLAQIAAIVVVTLVLSMGSVTVAAESLPGSPLYPVKRAVEQVQLRITLDPQQEAVLRLTFAERRANEIVALAHRGRPVDEITLAVMLDETGIAIRQLQNLPRDVAQTLWPRALNILDYQQIGVMIVLVGAGVLAYGLAGRSSEPAIARQTGAPAGVARSEPATQAQPVGQQPQPKVEQTQDQPAPQAASAPQSQPQTTSSTQSSSGSGGVSVAPASAPAKGEIAPDFSVPTLDGGTFSLAEQRGKPTVVLFMAYWCPTCVPEAQALKQLHEEYGDKVSILALDVDPSSSPEALQQFVDWAGNPDYVFGFDKDNSVLQRFKVRSLDTTIIIDADGKMVYRDGYPTPYKNLKAELEKLVS